MATSRAGDDRYVISAGPLANVEEVLPVRLQPALPPARHLVEADRGDRTEQADAG